MRADRLVGVGLAMMLAAAIGCGGTTNSSGAAGSGGSGASAGSGGTGAGGNGTGGDDGSCSPDDPCSGGGICIYAPGSCDPGATGVCQNGFTCDGPATGPVCLCDGTVLEGEYAVCDAWTNSSQLAEPADCATGTFTCGDTECTRNAEVCIETLPGPGGSTPIYSCEPSNGSCSGIPHCSCLDQMALGCPDSSCCSADGDNQETLTIALP